MNLSCQIALILPRGRIDYLTGTILDGLVDLRKENPALKFFVSETKYDWRNFSLAGFRLAREAFVAFARQADLICLMWGKDGTDYELTERIARWDKTVFLDGSELGRARRYDFLIQKKVLMRGYKDQGRIDEEMLKKCTFYFRREKPYLEGIIPLPFGIESRYLSHCRSDKTKDIDFICVFGQDEYPILRRYVSESLVKYCQANGFSFHVEKTKNQDEFYELLSKSKVGISVSGGGFDTARFWEILANNCLLLTERIDIFEPDSQALNYQRVWQFDNLFDFQFQLEKLAKFLQEDYRQEDLKEEYQKILAEHSSRARVLKILTTAKII